MLVRVGEAVQVKEGPADRTGEEGPERGGAWPNQGAESMPFSFPAVEGESASAVLQ